MFLLLSADPGTFSALLADATSLWTWLITQMGTLVTFIVSHPVVLMLFIIGLAGVVIGMLGRIWGSFRL